MARTQNGAPDPVAGEGSFTGASNLRLHFRTWEVAEPCCALLLVHGHGEHSGRYAEFARRATAFGVSVYAFDLRGHGRSEGRRGHAARFDDILKDVDRFRHEIEGMMPPATPLYVLGQSMGGLVALRYVQEFQPPLAGLVLVSPWLATMMPVPRRKLLLAQLIGRVLPSLPFHTRLNPEHLTHDAAMVQAYRDDRYVHDILTPRLFFEISSAMGLAFQRADRVHVRLLLLLAGDDPIVDTRRSEALARALPARDVTVRVFPGMRHEPLNEIDRARVVAALRDWLQPGQAPKFSP